MASDKGKKINGNVHPENRFDGEGVQDDGKSIPIEKGNAVAVTPKARLEVTMGPCDLLNIGWPNEFRVLDIAEADGEQYLSLYPCCNFLRDRTTNQFLCKWHLAKYFRRVALRAVRLPTKDDRLMTISSPWGDICKVEYSADEHDPRILAYIVGIANPIEFRGVPAVMIARLAMEAGIL